MAQQPFHETQQRRRRGHIDYRDLKKHLVRVDGWLPAFARHSNARGSHVRYLTLCAKEAIDVRYFAQRGLLARNDAKNEYPSLTFIEADEEDYAVIAETLGRVRLGVRARLEDVLLDRQHPSHADLAATFPHEVVNLDFCGDIIPRGDHPYGETLRCIDKVLELQADAAAGWHMFITFRALRTRTNDEANVQLQEIIDGNLARGDFREAYVGRPLPAILVETAYPEFLRVSISKFLAHAGRNRGYAVEIESSWVYSRREGAYHIVKLVAALRPLRPRNSLPNPYQEGLQYDQAVAAIFRSQPRDVDQEIQEREDEIRQELDPVLRELEELGIVTG